MKEAQVEQVLKQRLVGAAVIIALAIIVIPIVLDSAGERQLRKIPDAPKPRLQSKPGFVVEENIGQPSEQQNGQIVLTLPPEDRGAPPSDKVIDPAPAVAVKDAVKKKKKVDSPAQASREPRVAQPKTAAKPVVKPKPIETKKPKPEPVVATKPQSQPTITSKKKSSTDIWVVQVGSFTDAKKAFRLRDELLKKKFKAFVEKIRGRSGQNLYRVRVGPLPERKQAEALSIKLKQQSFKGYVTRHP
jgi:DedD protein